MHKANDDVILPARKVIYLDEVRVPASHIIGEPGMGFTYQMLQFQEERLAAVALSLEPLEHAITATAEYCRSVSPYSKVL